MKSEFLKIIMFITLLFVGAMMTNMNAQTHLKKWVEKCETIESVNYSVISKKDKITKMPTSTLVSISFKADAEPTLKSELYGAISKDKQDAVEIIESKQGGVLKPQVYKFYDGITKQEVSYIFSESKNGTLSVVITTGETGPLRSVSK